LSSGLRQIVEETAIECGLELRGCWEVEHRRLRGMPMLPWTDGEAPITIARTVPGGVVEPAMLVTGIARAAAQFGATICEDHFASLRKLGTGTKIKVKGQELSPKHVILALNAWTSAFVEGVEIHSALTYACVTEPLSEATLTAIGLAERIPFYTADTPYLWGRVCADRSVVFGAGLTYGDPAGLERVAIEDKEPAAILDRLVSRIRALNPALVNVRIAARWAGPIAFRKGAIPILARHPEAPNVLIAGAYAGHGVAFSVNAGRMMADAIVDGTPLPGWGRIE
jgi:gamma-glutamylputrescine oxidase